MGAGGWIFPVAEPAPLLCLRERARDDVPGANDLPCAERLPRAGCSEQAMDELAAALDIDPLELRRLNHVERDQARTALLEQAAARLLRPRRGAPRLGGPDSLRAPRPDGLLRGMGCASQIWYGDGGPPAHATIRIDADGHALVLRPGSRTSAPGTRPRRGDRGRRARVSPSTRPVVRGGDTGPQPVFAPLCGRVDDHSPVMPAVRRALGEGATHPPRARTRRARDLRGRTGAPRRADPLERRRARRRVPR